MSFGLLLSSFPGPESWQVRCAEGKWRDPPNGGFPAGFPPPSYHDLAPSGSSGLSKSAQTSPKKAPHSFWAQAQFASLCRRPWAGTSTARLGVSPIWCPATFMGWRSLGKPLEGVGDGFLGGFRPLPYLSCFFSLFFFKCGVSMRCAKKRRSGGRGCTSNAGSGFLGPRNLTPTAFASEGWEEAGGALAG